MSPFFLYAFKRRKRKGGREGGKGARNGGAVCLIRWRGEREGKGDEG